MVDEQVSAWASRAQVRAKLDAALDQVGGRLAGALATGEPPTAGELSELPPPDDPEARRNHPSNEQGAQHLMAVAAGAVRTPSSRR